MLQVQFYLLLFVVEIYMYNQSDYEVVSERFEFIGINEKYIGNLKYINFKYNRTYHALNATWTYNVDFGNNLKVVVQGYKMASNEYRLFPIQFDTTVCKCLAQDLFGVRNLYKCGRAPQCPLKRGNYSVCKWQPDYSKFPPYIPSGSYRLDFNFTYLGQQTIVIQWYMIVKRDLKWN